LGGQPHIFDAISLAFQARIFAGGALSAPAPADAAAFDVPFMVRSGGRGVSQYPPGGALLLVPFVGLGGGWLSGPFLAVASLLPVYLTARRLYGAGTALLALGLGAVSPFLLLLSGSFFGHPTALLCCAWALYFLVR